MTNTMTTQPINADYLALLRKIETIQDTISGDLVKDSTVKTGSYAYSYMKLDDLDPLVRAQCKTMGLRLYYPSDAGYQGAGIVDLDTGAKEEFFLPLSATPRDIQDLGKYITYVKRYALFNVIGVYGASDNDGVETKRSSSKPSTSKSSPSKPSTSSSGDMDFTNLF